ncbi:Putative transcriptional regulator, Crp/Fnr family (plasmid) [Mesorhizobium loti]|nr:Putative transcriptional regulator, Crp/Fnr family [Mesorhizobium loti]BCH04858.1 hypothetical protein MesoLj131b_68570 [Mesorhizobium sp. 131-2-5]
MKNAPHAVMGGAFSWIDVAAGHSDPDSSWIEILGSLLSKIWLRRRQSVDELEGKPSIAACAHPILAVAPDCIVCVDRPGPG